MISMWKRPFLFVLNIIFVLFLLRYANSFLLRSNKFIKLTTRSIAIHSTKSSESITPAKYVDDLYGALGVSKKATREELRDAYWDIAARNHPDRNKTQQALEIFQNASYAYQILGRDEKIRRNYDSKYSTKEYISTLETVGTDIIVPLTMQIAVPLLNMTAQVIGSYAFPMLRDAFEQSNAALKAAIDPSMSDDTSMSTGLDPLTRAGIALERKSFEQQSNKIISQIILQQDLLDTTLVEYDQLSAEERNIQSKLQSMSDLLTANINIIEQLSSDKAAAETTMNELKIREEFIKEKSGRIKNELTDFKRKAESKDRVVQTWKNKVQRLEAELAAAKQQLSLEENGLSSIQSSIKQIMDESEVLSQEQIILKETKETVNQNYRKSCHDYDIALNDVNSFELEIKENTNKLNEQQQEKGDILKKLNQIKKKKDLLDADLGKLHDKRVMKEEEYEAKKLTRK